MFHKIINEKIYCGLDIGSQTIKAGLLNVSDPNNMELLGAYQNKTYGYKDGSVSDLGELSECIHRTIDELSKKTGIKIKDVQLGIGGDLVDMRETSTVIPLVDRGSKVITGRDMKVVNDQAKLLGTKLEEEILHDLPQYYLVDDVNTALNPLGLHGRKLGVHSLMILTNVNRLKNITKAVHNAGYEIANLYFGSYAAQDIVLSEDDIREGCVLIDMGSKVTTVLVFKDRVLKFLEKIYHGGDNITQSIAEKLSLPFDLAEEIKKSYAVALSADHNQEEEILVKRESKYIPLKREEIYRSIEPVIERLIISIQSAIRASGLFDQINKSVVMIGGGALLPGLIERVGQTMNIPVRLGRINVSTKKKLVNAAAFSSVIGLAQKGYKKPTVHSGKDNGQANWKEFIVSKVRELYQEYF